MSVEDTGRDEVATSVYLDACCLNRPFDDQTQVRIHLEAEAVLAVLSLAVAGKLTWVSSEVVDFEISRNPDSERRQRVALVAGFTDHQVVVDDPVEERARKLEELGLHSFDALHLACAEIGEVTILLTTDDQFQRTADRHSTSLKTRVANPLAWIQEVEP